MQAYLDYMANTPVDKDVLAIFNEINTQFFANPNSLHSAGLLLNKKINKFTEQILNIFNLKDYEIIYTSCASEANNLACKGIARAYRHLGKHIISTYLEHSSLSASLTYLKKIGYEIDFVNINKDGKVDIEHLKKLIKDDTILVSISYVDSELGTIQPIKEIKEILKNYPNCIFHTDATQAIGKTLVDFSSIDLITFAPHKFFGLNSCAVLIKREDIILESLISGGKSTTIYRSGTPDLAMIACMHKALQKVTDTFSKRLDYVLKLNNIIKDFLKKYACININSTDYSVPHIINFSILGLKATDIQQKFDKHNIYISTKSACDSFNTPSRAVFAICKDKKIAYSSVRISFCHLTTMEEINYFLKILDKICKNL